MNKKQIIILSLLFFVVVYLMPFLFTQKWLTNIADFSNDATSNIGSTIGGITAPLIGIVSSILLYLALTKQIEANNIQKVKNETDTILSLINQMEVELSTIYYSYIVTTPEKQRYQHSYHGIEALDKTLNDFLFKNRVRGGGDKFEHYHIARQILLVISSFEIIEERIKQLTIPEDMNKLLVQKLSTFYEFRLKKPLSLLELVMEIKEFQSDTFTDRTLTFLNKHGKDNQLISDMREML